MIITDSALRVREKQACHATLSREFPPCGFVCEVALLLGILNRELRDPSLIAIGWGVNRMIEFDERAVTGNLFGVRLGRLRREEAEGSPRFEGGQFTLSP
jgi:hypothetical protein